MTANAWRLLVVDDDADMLRLLSMRLQAAGYRVATAASAESALAQLELEARTAHVLALHAARACRRGLAEGRVTREPRVLGGAQAVCGVAHRNHVHLSPEQREARRIWRDKCFDREL